MASNSIARRQAGFTLIEILVTVVVLSIGLLGIAGMQAYGMRNNHAAYTKTQATNLAIDMADRIRANPKGVDNYVGLDTGDADTIPADPDCISTGCSAEKLDNNLADSDMFEWSQPIISATKPVLPNGRGIIARNGVTDEFSVTILWHDSLAQVTEDQIMIPKKCKDFANQDIAAQTDQMACFQLRFIP